MKELAILIAISIGLKACQTTVSKKAQQATDTIVKAHNNYEAFFRNMSPTETDSFTTQLATFLLRKPVDATWETKFNPEYKNYYFQKRTELKLKYHTTTQDTCYFFVLREARTPEGIHYRGTGGKYRVGNAPHHFIDFEEVFVTRILPETELEQLGISYMNTVTQQTDLSSILTKTEQIEWPDGRLFYSKQKKEWRYVDP